MENIRWNTTAQGVRRVHALHIAVLYRGGERYRWMKKYFSIKYVTTKWTNAIPESKGIPNEKI